MEMVFMEQRELFPNKLLLVLFTALMAYSNGHAPISKFEYIKANDTALHLVNDVLYRHHELYTGIVYLLNADNIDTAECICYKAGKPHGLWKIYHSNHLIKSLPTFDEGKKTSDYYTWWENGTKQIHYQFKNDEYEGICKEWNSKGPLIKEMNYKKGHEDGSQKLWFDNGKVKANYIIKNGRRFGLLGTKNCVNVKDSIR